MTYPDRSHGSCASTEDSVETGAPTGYLTLRDFARGDSSGHASCPALPVAMEDAFREWWSRNAYALEDGGCGDVASLFAALCAASQKA